ncbi:hypothetical protein [Marinilactibacillus kalidii]|uniref:hypothetical protein n=1 Tax=Marinilactibacillus kalidii TaxID=2820274 RepID=UPI001ABDD638|nr:hypothetical protein [Marinilactibacillus kalidii]
MNNKLRKQLNFFAFFLIVHLGLTVLYAYSKIYNYGFFENFSFYGRYFMIFCSVITFLMLLHPSKNLAFQKKILFRFSMFFVLVLSLYIGNTIENRTIGNLYVISDLLHSEGQYYFVLKGVEKDISVASYEAKDVVQNKKIIVPDEMVTDYNPDESYVATFTYLDLGNLGFYYHINEFE